MLGCLHIPFFYPFWNNHLYISTNIFIPEIWGTIGRLKNHIKACASYTSVDCMRCFCLKNLCMIYTEEGQPRHHHSKRFVETVEHWSQSRVPTGLLFTKNFADFQRHGPLIKRSLEENRLFFLIILVWTCLYLFIYLAILSFHERARAGTEKIFHVKHEDL